MTLARLILPTLAAAFLTLAARAETLTTTDGRTLTGTLVALDAKQLTLRTASGNETIPLASARALTFDQRQAPDPLAKPGQSLLTTEDTARLALKTATIADGKLTATSDLVPAFTAPVEALTRLYRPRAHEKPADLDRQADAQKLTRAAQDTLLVNAAGTDWVTVSGLLATLAADKLTFTYEGAESPMDPATVPLVEFAQLAKAPNRPAPVAQLLGTDGSRLPLVSLQADAKSCRITTPALGTLTLDPARIAAIRFQNDSATYLSDLTPASITQTPFFDESLPYRKDASVTGTPLTLHQTPYEKGLGLHARCQLTFELAAQYKSLTAAAGIDDSVRTGAATLTLLGDGKPLTTASLQAGQPATALRVDLTGIKTLTVRADFADHTYGAGARVNLCDPILTK